MARVSVQDRSKELAERFELPPGAPHAFLALLDLLAAEPSAVTSVRDPDEAIEIHVADSLTGLLVPAVRSASTIADIGAGGGLPGLVLAIARPDARVTLIESVGGKATFIERTARELDLGNVEVLAMRAEEAPREPGFDVVTARALGSLPLVLEYAAPLLVPAGSAVAWKGERDAGEEDAGAVAAAELGLSTPQWVAVDGDEVRGARSRHLVTSEKVAPTPERYPRRPGVARKRPLGS
jgi:16S rRNA (guanine527-N7)-methyltransferase